jgi:hypothetical protein
MKISFEKIKYSMIVLLRTRVLNLFITKKTESLWIENP